MSSLSENALSDAMDIVRRSFEGVEEIMQQDRQDMLLRKFKKEYDRLDPMTIMRVRMALGHRDSEQAPCEVCSFINNREMKLAQQEI